MFFDESDRLDEMFMEALDQSRQRTEAAAQDSLCDSCAASLTPESADNSLEQRVPKKPITIRENVAAPYFKQGNPSHHLSYCAVLSILGFSRFVRQSGRENKHDELLRTFHTLLSGRIGAANARTKSGSLHFKSLNDNIVLACPHYGDKLNPEFDEFFELISAYQLEMVQNGFFLRGGVSEGNLFVNAFFAKRDI